MKNVTSKICHHNRIDEGEAIGITVVIVMTFVIIVNAFGIGS
jgi:hypothetical protein